MAFSNRRGGYGNSRGGNRGGSNGNRGGFRGGNRGGNRGGGGASYLRSSTFIRKLKFENAQEMEAFIDETIEILEGLEYDPKGVDFPLPEVGSEELAMTYTSQKVQDLKDMIEDAENDPQGDGGIRVTTYIQHKVNQDTGEEFDGASSMIVGKFPPRNQQRGGGRNSSFKGRGGGRRDYGQNDDQGGDEGNEQETANEDTKQSGRRSRGSRTQDSQKGGRTRGAAKNASHSEESDESYADRTGKDTDKQEGNYDEPNW